MHATQPPPNRQEQSQAQVIDLLPAIDAARADADRRSAHERAKQDVASAKAERDRASTALTAAHKQLAEAVAAEAQFEADRTKAAHAVKAAQKQHPVDLLTAERELEQIEQKLAAWTSERKAAKAALAAAKAEEKNATRCLVEAQRALRVLSVESQVDDVINVDHKRPEGVAGMLLRKLVAWEREHEQPERWTYQRDGELVRLVADTSELAAASLRIEQVPLPALRARLSQTTDFYRENERGDRKNLACTKDIAEAVAALQSFEGVPELRRATNVPFLRPDGTLYQEHGHDEATQTFLDLRGITWPRVSEEPTHEEVQAAIAALKHLMREFCFAGPNDYVVILSGLLSLLARQMYKSSAPVHAITSAEQESAKSKLVYMLGWLLTGRTIRRLEAKDKSDAELVKELVTYALEGDPIINIDNLTREFGGEVFAGLITGVFSSRILGKNKSCPPLKGLVFVNGVNLSFDNDLVSRTQVCTVTKPPHERDHFDMEAECTGPNRWIYLSAAITILRGYVAADRPQQQVVKRGGLESWTAIVPSALVWAGCADPGSFQARRLNLADGRQVDARRDALVRLLRAIGIMQAERGPDEPIIAQDLRLSRSYESEEPDPRLPHQVVDAFLLGSLPDLCNGQGKKAQQMPNSRQVSWYLDKVRRTPVQFGHTRLRLDFARDVANDQNAFIVQAEAMLSDPDEGTVVEWMPVLCEFTVDELRAGASGPRPNGDKLLPLPEVN